MLYLYTKMKQIGHCKILRHWRRNSMISFLQPGISFASSFFFFFFPTPRPFPLIFHYRVVSSSLHVLYAHLCMLQLWNIIQMIKSVYFDIYLHLCGTFIHVCIIAYTWTSRVVRGSIRWLSWQSNPPKDSCKLYLLQLCSN